MNKEEIRHLSQSYYDLHQKYYKLQKENKQLKEKLDKYENPEDMTLFTMWCTEKVKDENKQLKETQQKVEEQQKKFINYLQEELNVQIQEESIGCEITNKKYILEEILQKYKEIIGVSNEKK